jgi:hypothetical protein
MRSTQIAYPKALNVWAIDWSKSTPNALVALVGQIVTQSRVEITENTKVALAERATVYAIVISQYRCWSLTQPGATIREPERRSSLEIPILRVCLDSRTDDLSKCVALDGMPWTFVARATPSGICCISC